MRKLDQYLSATDTMYPDSYTRENVGFDGGMIDAAPFDAVPRNFIERLMGRYSVWKRKRDSRLALKELTPEQLLDIGLTRQDVEQELAKAKLLSLPSRGM